MEKMMAAIRRKYGSPKTIQLEHIDVPVPNDREVLVRVKATTVNRTDCANLTAKPFIMRFVLGLLKPRKSILGTDFAGVVIALGNNVSQFKIKDRVFGFSDMGLQSQAEYLCLSEDILNRIPENIDYKMAVASLEGAHYAYTFIHKTNINAGNRVLINGATGAIGSALIQFVKPFDVHITATANTKNIEMVRALGADKIYDYTKEDFTKGNQKYDFIFDTVGKSTFGKCKPLLHKGGIYISSELGPYGQNIPYALITPVFGGKKVIFPIPYSTEKTIPYIIEQLKKGLFKPVIDNEFPLAEIAKAYTYVIRGEKTGNVLITPENTVNEK